MPSRKKIRFARNVAAGILTGALSMLVIYYDLSLIQPKLSTGVQAIHFVPGIIFGFLLSVFNFRRLGHQGVKLVRHSLLGVVAYVIGISVYLICLEWNVPSIISGALGATVFPIIFGAVSYDSFRIKKVYRLMGLLTVVGIVFGALIAFSFHFLELNLLCYILAFLYFSTLGVVYGFVMKHDHDKGVIRSKLQKIEQIGILS